MQTIRIRRKNDPENKTLKGKILQDVQMCIDFNLKEVLIWNGVYWESTPFSEFKTISTWEGEEGKEE